MENGIYIALSRQVALRSNLDTIANNIANMNTAGYRQQNMLFEEYLVKERSDFDPMSFVNNHAQYTSTEPGSMTQTGNPLDIAVAGPGFIGVQSPDGIRYTRAGNFQMDANGQLLTSAGDPVADAGGAAITIPADSSEIKIDERGFVSNQDGQIGQIMIAEFADLRLMKPVGHTLYETTQPPLPPQNSKIKQGTLEGSNVKPVLEMTNMIDTLRTHQSVQNILQGENERLRTLIQRITRQG
jgi:flagellar basal-body rod protein FlgF